LNADIIFLLWVVKGIGGMIYVYVE